MKINGNSFQKNISNILNQLRELGISNGDTILITADLLSVGLVNRNRGILIDSWIDILMNLVGPDGTIVLTSYSKSFFRFAKNKNLCFSRTQRTTSGALSQILLDTDLAIRSTHPTNSIVAIGKHARYICEKHTRESLCYDYVETLIEFNGKHLMLGTLDRNNAPAGFHYAQQLIGETRTTPGFGLFQCYYFDESGAKRLFTKWDGGGCSGAGYKVIGHHLIGGDASIGVVGNSISAVFNIKRSIELCRQELVNNRRYMVCDDEMCLTCKGRYSTSGLNVIPFYLRYIFKKLPQIIKKIKKRRLEEV